MIYTNFNLGKYVIAIISSILGFVFLFVESEFLLEFILYAVGILFILKSLFMISILSKMNRMEKKYNYELYYQYFTLALSIILLFFPNAILLVVLGFVFILNPIIKIIQAKFQSEVLFRNIFKIFLGVFVMLVGFNSFIDVIFKIFGVIFLIIAIVSLILIIKAKRNPPKQGINDSNFHSFFSHYINEKNEDIIDGEVLEDQKEEK